MFDDDNVTIGETQMLTDITKELNSAKKRSKGAIVAVILLFIIVLGLIGYICYDKGVFDKYLGKEDKKEVKTEKKLSEEEVMKLHDSLTVNDEFGPYFSTNINADNIKAEQFISYVISVYVNDKNITNSDYNLGCVTITDDDDEEWIEECKKAKNNAVDVSKEELKSYIKEKFNIDKDFDLDSDYFQYLSNSKVKGFKYSKSESKFYFGYGPGAQGEQKVFNSFIKYEQSSDNLYIYDKAALCISGYNKIGCYKTFDDLDSEADKTIYNESGSAFKLEKNSLFEKINGKVNTYKHTFKKGTDGKYYWYSSEIVDNKS